jgi:glutamate mutase epsilon subunit
MSDGRSFVFTMTCPRYRRRGRDVAYQTRHLGLQLSLEQDKALLGESGIEFGVVIASKLERSVDEPVSHGVVAMRMANQDL